MDNWLSINPAVWAVGALTLIIAALTFIVRFSIWVGKMNEHRITVHAFMDEIRKDIKDILGRLGPPATTATDSPTTLTDLGRSISQLLGASEWAKHHAAKLAGQASGMPAYDIQQMASRYVKEKYAPDDEMEAKIKQSAYENGIKREQVLDVLAVELRDVLLSGEE